MGYGKALARFSTFMLILMVASIPFVQPSRTSLQVRTTDHVAESTVTLQGIQMDQFGRFGNGVHKALTLEDSERKVPTGPDPLHHNNNPRGP